MKAWTFGEPFPDDGSFVGSVIVHNNMHLESGGHLRLDHIEELAKFPRAVAAVQLANHAAGLQFQRGKRRSRAMAFVVMCAALHLPRLHRPCISVCARRWTRPLAFGNARLTDRRAGRRWLFCREECKQRDSNHAKDHNVLGAILPVHPVRHGLRRHDCHRAPMGKA